MTNDKDLLSIVQPSDGWIAVLGIKDGDDVIQTLVSSREEVDSLASKYMQQERNVFFGVARFETGENRKKPNVKALRAFWLDIDCGEEKAKINSKTGRPDGYIDQASGLQALKDFCKLIGLPKPMLVDSGRGIHVYWVLDRDVSRAEWEPVAARLRELCVLHNFHIDGKVFEVARVLRIPGTLNFKDNPPSKVSIMSYADPIGFDEFCNLLGVKQIEQVAPKREMSALAKSLMGNSINKFGKIMVRSAKGTGCRQLMEAYESRESLSEPRWFDALSIAKFCVDRDNAIHKLSKDYPGYDYNTTEEKVKHIVGPHSCVEFDKSNPGGCEGCPHQGKIKSPIVLGREILEATEEDNVVPSVEEDEEQESYTIPKYPSPYFRGKNGGIYMSRGDEEEPILVYEHDLYVTKLMKDPILMLVAVMKLHLPKDGIVEFVIPNAHVTGAEELRKTLSGNGVACNQRSFKLLADYLIASVRELQFKRKSEEMRQQFGWADKKSKFIIGDREITPDGTYHSPPSSMTKNLADNMQPTGSFDKWKEVFDLYGTPGLEASAFAALTAFGSPLLGFLGQNGAVINLINSSSGTGKTTVLHMCNSVYGNPSRLCAMWDDTQNAKFMRLGIMNNLPFTIDEMTNMLPLEFSTLVYGMSQGRGKDRVKSSANELRLNLSSWQSISLCSSNASFYEKMASLKSSPDGELMRLLEYRIDQNTILDPAHAKHMFDHQLMENYGHAGDIYAKWLVENMEEAKNTALGIQKKIDNELKLTQRERFWSAVVAANITGGLIAKTLGLLSWDMKLVYQWATKMLLSLRTQVKPPAADVMAVIGDYINRHMQNVLVVNDGNDRRTNMAFVPIYEPRSELLIRYEPDTKRMFIAAKPFKNDCVKYQVNYKDTLQQLGDKGIFLSTANKRLSKGMKIVSPGVHCLIFDCSGSEFLDMDSIVPTEPADESRGD